VFGGSNGLYRPGHPLRMRLRLDSPEVQCAFAEFERVLERLVASGRRVFIVVSSPTSPQFDPRSLVPAGEAVGADGMPLYIDSNHLRAAYARERASFLDVTLLEPDPR
jgi:hypothetical protein